MGVLSVCLSGRVGNRWGGKGGEGEGGQGGVVVIALSHQGGRGRGREGGSICPGSGRSGSLPRLGVSALHVLHAEAPKRWAWEGHRQKNWQAGQVFSGKGGKGAGTQGRWGREVPSPV